ncbi:TlpA disulfide reductase family protein [Myroides injenensis]|uniref:TlpA disulfide reductase family protein n=1 Tax=Myroides injenensis TaxID=1183151 RepID=UPI000289528A|nr:TlpA disulfide reductase family protein [Myroides injenensis]
MKKLSILFLSVFTIVSCSKKNSIEFEMGKAADDTKVEVVISDPGQPEPTVITSGKIKEGKVVLENSFTEIEQAFLRIDDEMQTTIYFIGEPGEIKITVDPNDSEKYKIGGTTSNDKIQAFIDELAPYQEKVGNFLNENGAVLMQLSSATDEESQAKFKELQDEYQKLNEKMTEISDKFEAANKDNALGVIMFARHLADPDKTIEQVQKEFDQFPEAVKNSKIGKETQKRITEVLERENVQKKIAVGSKIPNFKAKTPSGKEITLYEYLEGKKVVLIDVWASWCGPCRQENPNVVQTFKEFNKQGFDIIGYSLDKAEQPWLDAIQKDNLTWTQVSNLQFWNDAIVADYGIEGIPASFLVDGNGIIIAKDLRGPQLAEGVKEALKL